LANTFAQIAGSEQWIAMEHSLCPAKKRAKIVELWQNDQKRALSISALVTEHFARRRENREQPMKYFWEREAILWSLSVLLFLSGCGGAELECDSSDTRNSVLKIVSDDSNNALVNYAARYSSAVQVRINNASTESEKLAIWEKARQSASYSLGDAISTNSKSKDKRAVTCSGLLSATVEGTTAQKQVDFKVEQMPDGKVSVSVSPFRF
jgi:hypothetical protein